MSPPIEDIAVLSPGIRRRMLEAGQRVLARSGGLRISLDSLPMEAVIREAQVSRSSAYREWPSREAFHVDLLCHLAGPNWPAAAAFDEETIRATRHAVAENLELLQTFEGRLGLLRSIVQQGARQNFDAVVASPDWLAYVALTATVSTEDEAFRERISTALKNAEQTFIGRMSEFYSDLAILFGFRLRPGIRSFEVVAALGAAVVEGLALRRILVPGLVDDPVRLPTGADGNGGAEENQPEDEEWHLAALGFFAILKDMIEPVEDYDFAKAISGYLVALNEHDADRAARAGQP